jgi:hypothetical protein
MPQSPLFTRTKSPETMRMRAARTQGNKRQPNIHHEEHEGHERKTVLLALYPSPIGWERVAVGRVRALPLVRFFGGYLHPAELPPFALKQYSYSLIYSDLVGFSATISFKPDYRWGEPPGKS